MRAILILLFAVYITGLRSECPKWESVDVTHTTHNDNFHKVKGNYYAHAIIPRPEHANKKCIYFHVDKIDHHNFRVTFHSTDKVTNKDSTRTAKFHLNHDTSEWKLIFDDPNVEQWNELYLTDINSHFGINYHCRGDQMHPYAFTRKRKASQKVLDEMLAVLASRGVTRDQLTIVDQDNCKN